MTVTIDSNLKNNSSDVLIIGAGAAGLAAARDLSVAGRKVIVLEVRDRSGGRIFTYKDPSSPVPIELGAEFVHGKSPELFQIAKNAHLQLIEVGERHWYLEDGKLIKSGDFWSKIENLFEKMKSVDADQSFKDFLSSLPDDEESRRVKAMAIQYVEGFNAASMERISVKGLTEESEAAESIEGDKSFRFLDGYESLVQALQAEAEGAGASIHLNTTVKEIHWRGDDVEAVCECEKGPTSFTASRMIITLPLGVLQTNPDQDGAVQFIPELPQDKRDAINNLIMGNVVRLVLRFRERFWERLTLSDEDKNPVSLADAAFIHHPDAPLPTWWTQLPVRAPILVGWAGGPKADWLIRGAGPMAGEGDWYTMGENNRQPQAIDSFILDQAINSLSSILNVRVEYARHQLEASYSHHWHSDPFSRGAYSYVPVGGLDAQKILCQPIANKLFFAGEATSVGHFGTVHGAIQSGQRAAKQIIEKL